MALVLVDDWLTDDRDGCDLVGRGPASGKDETVADSRKCFYRRAVGRPTFTHDRICLIQGFSEGRDRGGR